MANGSSRGGMAAILQQLVVPVLLVIVLAGCGITSDEPEPPDASIRVRSGSYATTVRQGDDVQIPFSRTVLIDVEFKEPIYDPQGRTFAEAETEPIDWRVLDRQPENRRTLSFAIRNQEPGTVTVSVYKDEETPPVEFTLHLGEDEG